MAGRHVLSTSLMKCQLRPGDVGEEVVARPRSGNQSSLMAKKYMTQQRAIQKYGNAEVITKIGGSDAVEPAAPAPGARASR